MLTLFTWGYKGWGNATPELLKAVDATERRRGFKAPVFFDIRYSRSVRAKGFRDDTFSALLPRGRYRWLRRLGNEHIAGHQKGIKIVDPFAAKILLEEAIELSKEKRRVIFFCACEFPRWCHRHVVANLIIREAERIGRRIEIIEWPGKHPVPITLRLKEEAYDAVERGLVDIPLNRDQMPTKFVGLPWGSIVDVRCGKRTFPIISGPAKHFNGGWKLPIWERGEPRNPATKLRSLSHQFRKRNGLLPRFSVVSKRRRKPPLKALTIRQPWAHAIVTLGKDVENRSFRTNYKGLLLIHASGHHEPNPRSLLKAHMSAPPSEESLSNLSTGSIIGVADLFDRVDDSRSRWADKGAWHWLLRNAKPIKPIACTGRLGLWTPSVSIMRRLPTWIRETGEL